MLDATADPNLINQLGSQFEQMGDEPKKQVLTLLPPDTEVTLPGGFIASDGSLVKYAEIRELNGADEEAIAKSGSLSSSIATIISRGLVSLGGEKVKSSDLDQLLAGDRDFIALSIRIATFGKEFKFSPYCRKCQSQVDLTLDLTKDIEVKELDNPIADRQFDLETKSGRVKLGLPNGITQKKLADLQEKATTAELVTAILAGCIISVDGSPSMGPSTALALSIVDREKLVSELYDRSPGPRLGEVSKACEACGTELQFSLGLADLFRL